MTIIKSVTFQASNHRFGDREAVAIMDDGSEKIVFHWFSDELQFTTAELIGLTAKEAGDLKQKRDIAYLQS